MVTRAPVTCAVIAAALFAGSARADGASVSAEALFTEGRAALARGQVEEACAKLAESQRLDPAAGTLLNLAECEERRGHVASAWGNLKHALDLLAATDDRRAWTEQEIARLAARLPKLTVRFAAPSLPSSSAADVRVLRDGTELRSASLGVAFPVDPGPHTIVLARRGAPPRNVSVDMTEGESRVVVLDLGGGDVASGAARTATPSRLDPLGLVLGGTTIAALTLGIAAGIGAADRHGVMNDHCTPDRTCDPVGVDAGEAGRVLSSISTVSFVAGGILAASAAYWIFFRPRGH